jgi:hypothetical protein
MNRSSLIIVLAAAIAFGLGSFSSALWSKGDSSSTQKEGLSMRVVSLRESKNRFYETRIEYPQFENASREWNESIAETVNAHFKEFQNNIEENWKARQDTLPEGEPKPEFPEMPYLFVVTWDSEQLNEDFVSFVLRIDSFEGGANLRQEVQTFNYDFKSSQPVSLASLFPEEGEQYLSKISKYTRASLVSDLNEFSGGVPAEMIESGTEPVFENFKNFTFNDQAVIFYFPKYQVAPGSFGEQKVVLPRVVIQSF